MSSSLYGCTIDNNTCELKDSCKRYKDLDMQECTATLWKYSCTENNKHVLYMKEEISEEKKEEDNSEKIKNMKE